MSHSSIITQRLRELSLARLSNEKQRQAASSLLEAALLTGTATDVRNLRLHAVALLEADMDLQRDIARQVQLLSKY
jgi:hypothetical protein